MHRLFDIQEELNSLMQMDPSELAECRYLEDYADDIIRKLRHMRLAGRDGRMTPMSPKSPSISPRHTRSFLTPPASVASSSSTDSTWSDCTDLLQSAKSAFDAEIYARCVKIVETAAKNGRIDCALISLAHNSYLAMVDMAEDMSDARKHVHWWNTFLESVESNMMTSAEKIELLDYRITALERQYSVDGTRKKTAAGKLLRILGKAYQMTTNIYRPFHSKSIRRLEKWALGLEEASTVLNEDAPELREAHEGIEIAAERSCRDRQRYKKETSADEDRDGEYAMCSKILDNVVDSCSLCDIAPQMEIETDSIDELLNKVFPEGGIPQLQSPKPGCPVVLHF